VFDDGSDQPRLEKTGAYVPNISGFDVGTGHGSSPMLQDGKRYLLLAGKSGILRFDTESHGFAIEQLAGDGGGIYSNPKGVSYNEETGETILAQSDSNVYSLQSGTRALEGSEIYKAKWWQTNSFSDYVE